MKRPSEMIDHLTLLLETSTGVLEVDLGLIEGANCWLVVQLGQRIVSGKPDVVFREQIQEAMQVVGWPRMPKKVD